MFRRGVGLFNAQHLPIKLDIVMIVDILHIGFLSPEKVEHRACMYILCVEQALLLLFVLFIDEINNAE